MMANEISYIDPDLTTSLALEAKVFNKIGVQQGSDVALTESTVTGGIYYGDFPESISAGEYIVLIQNTTNTVTYAVDPEFNWDGENKVTLASIVAGVAAIQAKTDAITLTNGNVDANIEYVNGIPIAGTGVANDPWGPSS